MLKHSSTISFLPLNKKWQRKLIVFYGQIKMWARRKYAIEFYFDAVCGSEGSEIDRYANIYIELEAGRMFVQMNNIMYSIIQLKVIHS